jgi:hypothetical protein
MKLNLSADTRIKDIRDAFNRQFRYLQIEFFKNPHRPGQANPLNEKLPHNATLLDINGVMKEGEIIISSRHTVEEIEQRFQRFFHLPVQIFRKTRFGWLETTKTDRLTLYEQNQMGRDACHAMYELEVLL